MFALNAIPIMTALIFLVNRIAIQEHVLLVSLKANVQAILHLHAQQVTLVSPALTMGSAQIRHQDLSAYQVLVLAAHLIQNALLFHYQDAQIIFVARVNPILTVHKQAITIVIVEHV